MTTQTGTPQRFEELLARAELGVGLLLAPVGIAGVAFFSTGDGHIGGPFLVLSLLIGLPGVALLLATAMLKWRSKLRWIGHMPLLVVIVAEAWFINRAFF